MEKSSVMHVHASIAGTKLGEAGLKKACVEIYKAMIESGCKVHKNASISHINVTQYVKDKLNGEFGSESDIENELVDEIIKFHDNLTQYEKISIKNYTDLLIQRGEEEIPETYKKLMFG